jgi:hypothetical protein
MFEDLLDISHVRRLIEKEPLRRSIRNCKHN